MKQSRRSHSASMDLHPENFLAAGPVKSTIFVLSNQDLHKVHLPDGHT